MNKEKYLISFFGKSGSGKSTAAEIAMDYLNKQGIKSEKMGVAQPLHQMQKTCYGVLGIEMQGQDGRLLQFLAGHFEEEMLKNFEMRLDGLLGYPGSLVIINHDCRDNAYGLLRRKGFVFVKIVADDLIRSQRLKTRRDVSRGDMPSEIIKADYQITNNGPVDEFKRVLIIILNNVLT